MNDRNAIAGGIVGYAKSPEPPQPPSAVMLADLTSLGNRLHGRLDDLSAVIDRICGARPLDGQSGGEVREVPKGFLGELESAIRVVDRAATRLEAEAKRLSGAF